MFSFLFLLFFLALLSVILLLSLVMLTQAIGPLSDPGETSLAHELFWGIR